MTLVEMQGPDDMAGRQAGAVCGKFPHWNRLVAQFSGMEAKKAISRMRGDDLWEWCACFGHCVSV